MSHKENIKKVKLRQPTWSVNSIAQVVGLKYLEDEAFIKRTKSFIITKESVCLKD